jgi:stress-induced morphogen
MPTTAAALHTRLIAAFPDAEIEVRDTTGGGDHFAVRVVSSAFDGLSLIERHRQVYAALGEAMHSDVHALALTTDAPGDPGRQQSRKP